MGRSLRYVHSHYFYVTTSEVLGLKIGIISDTHLGFGSGPREMDCFSQAEEAFSIGMSEADVILFAGDLFDSGYPKPKSWYVAMGILSKRFSKDDSWDGEFISRDRELSANHLRGIPVVAIHGNHEIRRPINPIEALHKSSLLINLHGESVVLEGSDGKLTIHGMGFVPDKYAAKALSSWSPSPEEGFNVLMLHQSVLGYVYPNERPLEIGEIPKGFDLYVFGHIHTPNRGEIHGKPLLIPGSTVRTQLSKSDLKERGIFLFDVEKGVDFFVKLRRQRTLIIKDFHFKDATVREIEKEIREFLNEFPWENYELGPLIRIRILGELKDGERKSDLDLKAISEEFKGKGIISFSNRLTSKFMRRLGRIRMARRGFLSVKELALSIIEEEFGEMHSISPREIFQVLESDLPDEDVLERLRRLLLDNRS